MYRVVFSPECREELRELSGYLAQSGSRRIAEAYMARLKAFCLELGRSPYRGQHRPGVDFDQRTIGFERRVSVIFAMEEPEHTVYIVGVRYGGRSLDQTTPNLSRKV